MKNLFVRILDKKSMELVLGTLMLVVVSFMAGNTEVISTKIKAVNEEHDNFVVVVDAGHGGQDPGKVGVNDCLEKEVNLAIAFKVKELLEDEGVTVHMTRDSDEGLYSENDTNKKVSDLSKRCSLIEGWNADIAVSIHQNSYSDGSVKGGQVFYYTSSEEGLALAQNIQLELAAVCGKTRQVKANKDYYMLLNVKCPIVIVECGFLSNWEEAEALVTEDYQQKIAEAIVSGILEYQRSK